MSVGVDLENRRASVPSESVVKAVGVSSQSSVPTEFRVDHCSKNFPRVDEKKLDTKNINKVGKALAMLSSGQKINSAADDSASFAISEVMRAKLRALEQDVQNVQNGSSMLRTAEAGIQQQIDILRTIKEKVIDAANDHNNDDDRRIIQKEINQLYDQMEQTATYTDYNTKKVLLGDTFKQTTEVWFKLPAPVKLPDSDAMDIIPNIYPVLDNINGPFDIFEEMNVLDAHFDKIMEGESIVSLSGGEDGTARVVDVDFSGYNSIDDLNNVGIRIRGINADGDYTSTNTYRTFVFTNDITNNYRGNPIEIDISDCNSVSDAVAKLKQCLNSFSSYASSEARGTTLRLTSGNKTTLANDVSRPTAEGVAGEDGSETTVTSRTYSNGTPAGVASRNLSGGQNAQGRADDKDSGYQSAQTATYSTNVSRAAIPSGFTISYGTRSYAFEFTDSSDPPSYNSARGVYTIGKNAAFDNFSISFGFSGSARLSLSNGTLAITAGSPGSWGNSIKVANSYQYISDIQTGTMIYTAYRAFDGDVDLVQAATADTKASYTIDLSGYGDVEELIDDLVGKWITFSENGRALEFIDKGSTDLTKSESSRESGVNRTIDLNTVREDVANGTPLAEAFANRFLAVAETNYWSRVPEDENEPITGIKVTSQRTGEAGNSSTLAAKQGTLRHYDIDYGTWFDEHPDFKIPDDLDGKGFRAYCASCKAQWFNFIFRTQSVEDRPPSGGSGEDVRSLEIDVSDVHNAADLVQAIVDQTTPILTGKDDRFNHYMRVTADTETGVLTLYDIRKYDVSVFKNYQQKGAKISDGILDDVALFDKKLYVRNLRIQDTDRSSLYINVQIPQTTLDHIFEPLPDFDNKTIFDYDVLTKHNRDLLLGTHDEPGILDRGLAYLLDANTLVGAQLARLEYTETNIVTDRDNVMAAESVIRDADMARELTNYTKFNVLQQASQSMLAQANQNLSGVLSLIQ